MNDATQNNQSTQSEQSAADVETVKKQAEEYLHGWKRARADYENLLKETARDRERMGGMMTEATVAAFLPVFDDLKRALQAPPHPNDWRSEVGGRRSDFPSPQPSPTGGEGGFWRQWVDGVRHIFAEFEDVLRQFGVSEIVAVGQKFDPALHESMGTETDQEKDDGVVLCEIEGGYTMSGRVVRPARVIVNKREL